MYDQMTAWKIQPTMRIYYQLFQVFLEKNVSKVEDFRKDTHWAWKDGGFAGWDEILQFNSWFEVTFFFFWFNNPNSRIFKEIFSAASRRGALEIIQTLQSKMGDLSLRPDIPMYRILLEYHKRMKNWETMENICKEMLENNLVDTELFSTMIDLAGISNKLDRIPTILSDMERRQISPDFSTDLSVFIAFGRNSELVEAIQTFQNMLKKYQLLPQLCDQVLTRLREIGLPKDIIPEWKELVKRLPNLDQSIEIQESDKKAMEKIVVTTLKKKL
jgi:hypothetical protein